MSYFLQETELEELSTKYCNKNTCCDNYAKTVHVRIVKFCELNPRLKILKLCQVLVMVTQLSIGTMLQLVTVLNCLVLMMIFDRIEGKCLKWNIRVLFFSWVKVYWGCAFKWDSKCLHFTIYIYIIRKCYFITAKLWNQSAYPGWYPLCHFESVFRFWSFHWDPMKRNRTNLACTMWSGATISQ